MTTLYNEIDPFCAKWLRNLIDAGHITKGLVDERSITDLRSADLAGIRRAHFFAGIGVWDYALRLAGWDDERDGEVWTGSCPCQPFSPAGRRKGSADERHFWPAWFRLIAEQRPRAVFGEQVADGGGLAWLDLVQADLESCDYAVGAVVLPAASVGAPHGRHRIFLVADAQRGTAKRHGFEVGHAALGVERAAQERQRLRADVRDGGNAYFVADRSLGDRVEPLWTGEASGPTGGFWADAEWLYCRDGKWRCVESGTSPLAHGAPARMGRLRAYGNAIVPQVAAAFIGAYMSARPEGAG